MEQYEKGKRAVFKIQKWEPSVLKMVLKVMRLNEIAKGV